MSPEEPLPRPLKPGHGEEERAEPSQEALRKAAQSASEAAPTPTEPDPREDDLYDRPMALAPAGRPLWPVALVAAGLLGVSLAVGQILGERGEATALSSPPPEEEFTTGVVELAPLAQAPPPAPGPTVAAPAPGPGAPIEHADAARLEEARRHAPLLIVGAAGGPGPRSTALDAAVPPARAAAALEAVVPSGDLSAMVLEGALIAATLETAIQSDLPGPVRAIVARDVHSADASQLLIPRGSRLIGEYRSGLVRGQTRVFAVWTRVLRPDGISVQIDAPLIDAQGRAGASGRRDSHFFDRFGAAILLTLIDAGVTAAADAADDRADGRLILDSGRDASRAAEIALQNSIAIPPTVHVAPGKRLYVFVNRDIDFSAVLGAPS